ncbi:ABC transporter permease [Streptococcus sp. zg-JUN1979]|uniref:ABC transporter permease n=1 Tax=Streptococcus sp. zg-JUN1979 TaxID=3391450 RepID=UPI0039A5217F
MPVFQFLKTLLRLVVMWFVIVTLSFFLFVAANPNLAISSLHANRIAVSAKAIASEKVRLGLDKPLFSQYVTWLARLCHGDLGTSYVQKESVTKLIAEVLPNTLLLTILTLILIAVIVWLYAKVFLSLKDHWLERTLRFGLLTFSSLPSFWLGLILLTLFAARLGWFPIASLEVTPSSLILPLLTMTAMYLGTYIRLIRRELLSNQEKDYMLYYRYSGMSRRYQKARLLRNSLTSTLSSLSISFPKLLAGSVIVETLFSFPGMGSLCITAIEDRDFPLIEGYICIMTALFLVLNAICQAYHQRFNMREKL